jgi:hypothetical protein
MIATRYNHRHLWDIMGMPGALTPGEPSSLIGATMTSPSPSYIESLDAHLDRNEQEEINADLGRLPYREITLTKGQVAIVDAADYDWLNTRKWYAHWSRETNSFYAVRNARSPEGKRITISMHREILGLEYGDGIKGDHKNGVTLDDRRNNLRRANSIQNSWNRKRRRDNTTGFTGVYLIKSIGKYQAILRVNGKGESLGYYRSAEEAHAVYCAEAKRLQGEFRRMG